jgi:hypothetical protein
MSEAKSTRSIRVPGKVLFTFRADPGLWTVILLVGEGGNNETLGVGVHLNKDGAITQAQQVANLTGWSMFELTGSDSPPPRRSKFGLRSLKKPGQARHLLVTVSVRILVGDLRYPGCDWLVTLDAMEGDVMKSVPVVAYADRSAAVREAEELAIRNDWDLWQEPELPYTEQLEPDHRWGGWTSNGHPMALDPDAESAEAGQPAFLTPPPGSPVYHGFVMLAGVERDGFKLGMVTDYLRETDATEGDLFVVAPDGSRAGIAWVLGPFKAFTQIEPYTPGRWGVWHVEMPQPLRTIADAETMLKEILPALRPIWEEWREAQSG